jgi:hypothetical protein
MRKRDSYLREAVRSLGDLLWPLAILLTLLLAGCGGGGGEKKVTRTTGTSATTATTGSSDPVTPLVDCLNKAGADAHTSEQRPAGDQQLYQPMVHAAGYVDAVDAWRSTGGYYIWVYRTHAQAQAAIKAQQASDATQGEAGLNNDLRAFENLAVGPGAGSATAAQTEALANCISSTPP